MIAVTYWLKIKLNAILMSWSSLNFSFDILFSLVIESYSLTHDWRCAFLKGRSEIDIFGYDPLIKQTDHTFIYIIFSYRRRITRSTQTVSTIFGLPPLLILIDASQRLLSCIAAPARPPPLFNNTNTFSL
jgi:hypothetical protein